MNIYDVAKEAGVSIATVSRVLNDPSLVSEKTRRKVEHVLELHNYTPNAIARGLVVKSMKTIGVLTIDIRDIYYANVAYTLETEFSKHGYNVILCNTGGDSEEKAKYIRMLSEKKVDGMILVGSVFKDDKINNLIEVISKEIPIVIVNGYVNSPNTYSIVCDDAHGVESCVDYLYNLGHRNFAYIQDADTYSALEKTQGFINGLNKYGLPLCENNIIKVNRGIDGGISAIDTLFTNKSNNLTAIIAGEDITAIGALKRLTSYGKNVPEDISVVGFNNSEFTRCCTPELTSVDNKMIEMGTIAATVLRNILEGKEAPNKTIVIPVVVVKSSTSKVTQNK